ncbi:MAG: DM13 domain-containing protein [Anaerolineales bacterium]|nr:DM13 domain-containing protein [Anaerolineales bacterium]
MKKRTWLILVGLLIVLPIGWYLISPLFINKTVDEDFPVVPTTETQPQPTVPAVAIAPTNIAAPTDTAPQADTLSQDPNAPLPTDMILLAQGEIYDLAHEGVGTASLYQLADGSRILRFENFEVLNGPDLRVYLAADDPIPNTVGSELAGGLDLGALKGNLGDQNYPIPADLDLSLYKSVVIWCRAFRVGFNAAPLRAPQS